MDILAAYFRTHYVYRLQFFLFAIYLKAGVCVPIFVCSQANILRNRRNVYQPKYLLMKAVTFLDSTYSLRLFRKIFGTMYLD